MLGDLAEVAGHRLGLVGIALVDWEARLRLSKEPRVVVEMLAEERGARILGSPVRHATAAAQAQRHGETLGDYAPGSDVLADYRELVTAYLEAIGLGKE